EGAAGEEVGYDLEADPAMATENLRSARQEGAAHRNMEIPPKRSFAQRVKGVLEHTSCGSALVSRISTWMSRSDHRQVAPTPEAVDDSGQFDFGELTKKVYDLPFWEAAAKGYLLKQEYMALGCWFGALLLIMIMGCTLSAVTSPSWVGIA